VESARDHLGCDYIIRRIFMRRTSETATVTRLPRSPGALRSAA